MQNCIKLVFLQHTLYQHPHITTELPIVRVGKKKLRKQGFLLLEVGNKIARIPAA